MKDIAQKAYFDTSFEERLAKVDLTAVMKHVADDTGLPAADLVRAEDLYRKFLSLIAKFPGTTFVPPRLVDHVWHAHITFTRQYMADCDLLFGSYLHHNPAEEGEEMAPVFASLTVPAYQQEYGINLMAYGMEAHYMMASDCKASA
ncbi:MAG: hypothetical protein DI628_02450 [Blastochloris viridis]|uniref:Glycine-rich domain-containing protein-like n=1 Tax=Blastochloris viridis TaxID=1079 RepID=A0A6N4R8L4_BLAVI|nr:MAG: hypothetical protein DI628_02450 [Blastochloris viridis]